MNPYAAHLGVRDPLETIGSTAAQLQSLVRTITPERAAKAPAPGKWSVREILCHLADTELAFAFRLRQALAEPHHVIQPFDQERWAERYAAYDAGAALAVFSAVREWNVRLIHSLPGEAHSKPVTHPERGEMTFRVLVETMAGHDLNHVRQIEAIAGQSAGA
jgi:hypothetical protein